MRIWNEFVSAIKEVFLLPFYLLRVGFSKFTSLGVRRIGLLTIAAVILTVTTAVIFVKATSTPSFCRSCHIMEPYFASWEASSHKNVQCIQCHIPPGLAGTIEGKFVAVSMLVNYTTGLYKRSKPWAEIDDINCTTSKCHDPKKMTSEVEWKYGIKFNHTNHLSHEVRNKQLRCTSCHGQIVQGAHINVTESTCFLCHFKSEHESGVKPKNGLVLAADNSPSDKENVNVFQQTSRTACTKCHMAPVPVEGKPAPRYDHTGIVAKNLDCKLCHGSMKSGNGDVPHERCNICHASIDHLNRIDDVEFMHQKHVTDRKVDCQNCHTPILHRSLSRNEAPQNDCQKCHSNLHTAAEQVFRGTGAIGVPDRPDAMWQAGLNCASCHTGTFDKAHFRGAKSSNVQCAPCHDANYEKLIPQWRNGMNSRIQQLQSIVNQAKRQAKSPEQKLSLDFAETNLSLLRDGGAYHNIMYAEDVLAVSYDQVKTAVPNVPSFAVKQTSHSSGSSQGGKDCATCHTGIESVNKLVNGRTFPHKPHLSAKLECAKCHSVDQHGKTLPDVFKCIDCHHERAKDEVSCKKCHRDQVAMYSGSVVGTPPLPAAMSVAEVECSSCHGIGKDITRPTPEQCADCHDKTYVLTLETWRKETGSALISAKARASELSGSEKLELLRKIRAFENDGSKGAHNPEAALKLLK
ncbi:MAG: NapC/NirT family cytochrome c [bacterium]|nr:NapC/NirT family cytochrome c [bacterium]